jgi:dipeptide/tripeptide permease
MPVLIRSALWVLISAVFFVEIWSRINGLKADGQYVSPWLYFGSVVFAFSVLFALSESWKNWKRYHAGDENG